MGYTRKENYYFGEKQCSLGEELRELTAEANEEGILEKIDKIILLHEQDLVATAKKGYVSYSLPTEEAATVAPLIYRNSKIVLPHIVNNYELNVRALQPGIGVGIAEVIFFWDKEASIENCSVTALR